MIAFNLAPAKEAGWGGGGGFYRLAGERSYEHYPGREKKEKKQAAAARRGGEADYSGGAPLPSLFKGTASHTGRPRSSSAKEKERKN